MTDEKPRGRLIGDAYIAALPDASLFRAKAEENLKAALAGPTVIEDREAHDHTGITCPFCGITTVCGHPVRMPPIPPWQANVWVKGP
jgi:hypothetical protein